MLFGVKYNFPFGLLSIINVCTCKLARYCFGTNVLIVFYPAKNWVDTIPCLIYQVFGRPLFRRFRFSVRE